MRIDYLEHNRVRLALHHLREGEGRTLLLLHPLGRATPSIPPPFVAAWPGPVAGLDFTGHGLSDTPRGGGYVAETLMGDADVAVGALGRVTVLGQGLGGYVALMIAGARPDLVRGVVIADGAGLSGGGDRPGSYTLARPLVASPGGRPDPYALLELSSDIRPPDYATAFARQATHLGGLQTPIAVTAALRPGWLKAVVEEPGVIQTSIAEALALFADVT